jgi:hypothetical protein
MTQPSNARTHPTHPSIWPPAGGRAARADFREVLYATQCPRPGRPGTRGRTGDEREGVLLVMAVSAVNAHAARDLASHRLAVQY